MSRWLTALVGFLFLGCGSPSVVQTALHGDLATLKRQIREQQEAGDLDRPTVVELARTVAGRELRSSKGESAVRRIRQVRACASPLVPVLRARAQRLDDAGAEATLLLFATNRLSAESLVERYRDASNGAWRAVAARAAVAAQHAKLRREFITDHDQRVRRAALRGALAAPHRDDLDELLEATRLDPDPLCRSLAARAAGAVGSQRAALSLKDYWARADETTRMMIIEGWAMPATFKAGGQQALVWAAETEGALPAIAAADALVRAGGESAELGAAVLLRAIKEGTQQERRLAIRLAPLSDPDILAELERASKDKDREVKVMALARLVGKRAKRKQALERLRKLAKGKDRIAVQARAALAAAGDRNVHKQLLVQLRKGSSHRRRMAALGLLRLGRFSGAATALADDDPSVRTAVACSMLTAAQRR